MGQRHQERLNGLLFEVPSCHCPSFWRFRLAFSSTDFRARASALDFKVGLNVARLHHSKGIW